jgi:hypothetical protein
MMTDDRQLDSLRREARALLLASTSGDASARKRATAVLGACAEERFVLADALHVVARERGAPSWPALVHQTRRGPVRSALDDVLDDECRGEIEVETDLAYPDGSPVVISVRQRERRYLIEDGGEAVWRAGSPKGWEEVAERAVRRSGMNVSCTTGTVFVPAVARRDLEALTLRLAQSSLDVLDALLELDEPERRRG